MVRNASSVPVLMLAGLALIFALPTGCSDSTDPSDDPGPVFTDVPDIPEPATPGGETGAHSDTVTVISTLATNFRPVVRSAFAHWGLSTRCCSNFSPFGDWDCDGWQALVGMPPLWSDALPSLSVDRCAGDAHPDPVSLDRPDPWQRFLLVENGERVQPAAGSTGAETMWASNPGSNFGFREDCQLSWQTEPLAELPHLRRDRFWVRRQLEGGAGNFLILIGDTEGEVSATYTSGSSTAETEEFGRSVTASAGLSLGALSLGVEVTLSQSFSTTVTVTEESSETFTKRVSGEDGKRVHFQVWELVEVYTVTDAEGQPFTDPNYVFQTSCFTIRGVAVALVATKFDV